MKNKMPNQEMIDANNDMELTNNYFYDEFYYKCSFNKINNDINSMNFCRNPNVMDAKYCSHNTCPFWDSRDE